MLDLSTAIAITTPNRISQPTPRRFAMPEHGVRQHELPDGGLAVVEEFRGHVKKAVTVSGSDRSLYELLIEIFAEADIKTRPCLAANLACEVETTGGAADLLADIERGLVSIGDRSYGMSITLPASRVIESHRERPPLQLVAVGCSGSKFDDPDPLPAKERYKGAYWCNKRDYGQLADEYRIISAEHDVLHPHQPIHDYDRTPADWRGVPVDSDGRLPNGDAVNTRLDQWALDVYVGLSEWIVEATDDIDPRDVGLEVLLGREYRNVLESRGVFDALPSPAALTISFPFQDEPDAQGGMFEQIGWMADEVSATVATDGGVADGE
jgi:hypothetical protein